MSVRLEWQPVVNGWTRTCATSSAAHAMERAFGSGTKRLTMHDHQVLRGMAAADPQGPWEELANAVEQHSDIELRWN